MMITGTLMFPLNDIGDNIDVEMGDFFFYYIGLIVCVFKACDQWFKTFLLLIAFHGYYFNRFKNSNIFES